MKNFVSGDIPFASALVGNGGIFVSEVDESDGSIALYHPRVAVLNNVTLDHKSIEELRGLFFDFAGEAEQVILNLDDPETALLAERLAPERCTSFSFRNASASLFGSAVTAEPAALSFEVRDGRSGEVFPVRLQIPGRHNAENGLAAIAGAAAVGVPLAEAANALAGFTGLRRRFEVVGRPNGITVIDDFAHNPDKIAATLSTLRAFPGSLLIFFQPHGYGPLRAMRHELIDCFAANLREEDVLILSDPVYFGGTVDRSVTSGDIVAGVRAAGRMAEHISDRAACGTRLTDLAQPGDRIIVMGARDDTLSIFAQELVASLHK
jgi:UDP-N-acetylmuramate--alanine ligase